MTAESAALDAVKRLTAVAEKLLHETERLRRDVAMLNKRVQPIEDGSELSGGDPEIGDKAMPRVKWPVPDALNMIDSARESIRNCEYELSAIRARMDNIAKDAFSRDEMKPWIKER